MMKLKEVHIRVVGYCGWDVVYIDGEPVAEGDPPCYLDILDVFADRAVSVLSYELVELFDVEKLRDLPSTLTDEDWEGIKRHGVNIQVK